MGIFSVNQDLEDIIKSDVKFVRSHFLERSYLLNSVNVSGQSIEPRLVGDNISNFEISLNHSAGVPHLLVESVKSVEVLLNDIDFLKQRGSLQNLLYLGDGEARPITGLPALLLLADLTKNKVKEKCFMPLKNNLYGNFISLWSYLSHSNHNFCSCFHDEDTVEDISESYEEQFLYMPFQIEPFNEGGYTPTIKPIELTSSNWFGRLVRKYSQGHYDLVTAVNEAQRNPFTFSLLVAPILGLSFDAFEGYSKSDSYKNLNDSQKFDYLSSVKPLIEMISFEYMAGEINNL